MSVLINGAIWSLYALILTQVPAIWRIDISVHGWGWIVLFGAFAVAAVLSSVVRQFLKGFFAACQFPKSRETSVICSSVATWAIYVMTLLHVADFFPNVIQHSASTPIIAAALLSGLVYSSMDLVHYHCVFKRV